MNITAKNDRFTVVIGDYIKADSSVRTGGGADNTEKIQAILDKAAEWGGLHLIVDGAYLTRTLYVYSNTKIECKNLDCGFYLKDNTDYSIFTNKHQDYKNITDRNIEFCGGTYNLNCNNQKHDTGNFLDLMRTPSYTGFFQNLNHGFRFYGVEYFTFRDAVIVDQTTFAMMFANWKHLLLENVTVNLPNIKYGQNQDGFHFHGPGQFLTMRNIKGCAGDDFISIAPDEMDGVSSITDVLIDGVQLDDADQGIRLLSKQNGKIDRFIIQNMTGTYKSYGFFINPWDWAGWTDKDMGNFGTITFKNIDLAQKGRKYDYTKPFLFRLGGKFQSVNFSNIIFRNEDPADFLQIGGHYTFWDSPPKERKEKCKTEIQNLVINGAQIFKGEGLGAKCIGVRGKIENMIINNALTDGLPLISMEQKGEIKNLVVSNSVTGKNTVTGQKDKITDVKIN